MKLRFIYILLLSWTLVSCSDYQKLLKSTDYELKWAKANEFFEQGKDQKVIDLLEDMQAFFKGTDRAEQTLYMLGKSYYNKKDYISASHYFESYYKTYPRGLYAEESRFLTGKAAYLSSPDPRLTQGDTYKAIELLQIYLEYFPESENREEVVGMLGELQDKLVYKELLNSRLYYDLGNYMGNNNYQACIVTANYALMEYPVSKYREELAWLVLRSHHQIALQSIEEKKLERYQQTIDEYYAFINEFPTSAFRKEADAILEDMKKVIKD